MSDAEPKTPPPAAEGADALAEGLEGLGRRIRALRESLTLTQEELGRRCGLSVSFVSLMERGARSPSYDTLTAVARALEVPLAELFREEVKAQERDLSHSRLLEFARRAQLSRAQVDRFIAVGHAMFGLEPERGARGNACSVESCGRPVLARGLCAAHYHRHRRARLGG